MDVVALLHVGVGSLLVAAREGVLVLGSMITENLFSIGLRFGWELRSTNDILETVG